MFFSTYAEERGLTGDNYKNLGWNVYSWKDDDDGLVYAQLYDAYGNDVLLFRVNTKEQLEAYGGIDGSSGSWDVVSKTYKNRTSETSSLVVLKNPRQQR